METKNRSIDVDKLCKSMDNGSFCFDMVIQRVVGQWSLEQQSLLIDTILRDYKIPAIWITRTETEQYVKNTVIDGNQRLHTIYDFVHDRFKLHKSIESITIKANVDNELEEDLIVELADSNSPLRLSISALSISTSSSRLVFLLMRDSRI